MFLGCLLKVSSAVVSDDAFIVHDIMELGLLSGIPTAKQITQWCRKCNYDSRKNYRARKKENELHKMGLGTDREILEMDIKV